MTLFTPSTEYKYPGDGGTWKNCSKCGPQPLANFAPNNHPASRSGMQSACRECNRKAVNASKKKINIAAAGPVVGWSHGAAAELPKSIASRIEMLGKMKARRRDVLAAGYGLELQRLADEYEQHRMPRTAAEIRLEAVR